MLIFTQVKHSLWLFTSGEDALKGTQDTISPFLNGHGLGFMENPWGMKAHEFITSIKKLNNAHWADITEDIFDLNLLGRDSQNMEVDSDEDNGNMGTKGRVNPHARIDID